MPVTPDILPSPIDAPIVGSGATEYQIDPDKRYRCVGYGGETSDPKDLTQHCPNCGGVYVGPLQRICPYCAVGREYYLVEDSSGAGDELPHEILKPAKRDMGNFEALKFSQELFRIGEESTIKAIARAGRIEIGADSFVDKVVCNFLQMAYNVNISSAIARNVRGSWSLRIDAGFFHNVVTSGGLTSSLIVIAHGGSLRVGSYSRIKRLVVGDDVRLEFGSNADVEKLIFTADQPDCIFGDSAEVGAWSQIDAYRVLGLQQQIFLLPTNTSERLLEIDIQKIAV